MSLTKAFKDAVDHNDVGGVRIMLKNSLLLDPSFNDFDEEERYASQMIDLYDEYDGDPFETDESKWNDDYMNEQMVKVVWNFSHERINHLKNVVRKLRPVKKNAGFANVNNFRTKVEGNVHRINDKLEKETHSNKLSYQDQKRIDQENGDYKGAKVAVGAGVGACAGALIAGVTSMSIVAASTTVVIGASIGAGIAYALDGGR